MPLPSTMVPLLSLIATIRAPRPASSSAAQQPTAPKPSIATLAPAIGWPRCFQARSVIWATPTPVDFFRKWLPPSRTGLPVTMAGSLRPASTAARTIQAMVCSPVPASGARTSRSEPMMGSTAKVYWRAISWSSRALRMAGLQATPPFAPPKGRPCNAVFQVISRARAVTSPRSTPGRNRMPPTSHLLTSSWAGRDLIVPSGQATGRAADPGQVTARRAGGCGPGRRDLGPYSTTGARASLDHEQIDATTELRR
jgi:hypothetical protein